MNHIVLQSHSAPTYYSISLLLGHFVDQYIMIYIILYINFVIMTTVLIRQSRNSSSSDVVLSKECIIQELG